MEKQVVVRVSFQVSELKGGMQFGQSSLTIHPRSRELCIELAVEGVEENGVVTVTPTELNKLVQDLRGIALAEMPTE